jgi:hypothetical protein
MSEKSASLNKSDLTEEEWPIVELLSKAGEGTDFDTFAEKNGIDPALWERVALKVMAVTWRDYPEKVNEMYGIAKKKPHSKPPSNRVQ